MELKLYRVVREHMGPEGQLYSPHGDLKTREAFPHEVAHLVPQTLELAQDQPTPEPAQEPTPEPAQEPTPEPTPEPAPENKADAAPENAAAKRGPRKPKEA